MIKFTPYFYKFKSMLLDKNIPIEFRAKFIIEKGLTSCWRKMYNHNMYTDDTVQNNLSMLLEDILYNLSKQISIVLKYLPEYAEKDEKDSLLNGEKLALAFLEKLTDMRDLIQGERQKASSDH